MKTFRYVAVLILFFFLTITLLKAYQHCISFAKGIAKPQLAPYIHDGNFTATFIEEGECADLHKTFFKGEKYRLVFAAVDALPKNVRIKILTEQTKVLFDNADHNYVYVWDFELESNEKLIVQVQIPETDSDVIKGGCIAVLFGIQPVNKRR
ncbi:MAG: hypothetical protein FWH18_03110 [Marinilabiliaceae bacterium]|nr:hypothetical protein [Marinilabiliaceae bacterium]